MKPTAHSVVGGARTDFRSKDKDEQPIGGDYAATMRNKSANAAFVKLLRENYQEREAPEPVYGIFYHPTGASWRHGK